MPPSAARAPDRAVDKENDKAPDFRNYAGPVEFGAGWAKTSHDGRDYISAKLDDPRFAAPVYATLTEPEVGAAVGLGLVALSLPRGARSKEHYASWDRYVA